MVFVCFCLGDCGGGGGVFWDAVEEVSVLMNGDVEKGKIKKEEKKSYFSASLTSFFWGGGAGAHTWRGRTKPDMSQPCSEMEEGKKKLRNWTEILAITTLGKYQSQLLEKSLDTETELWHVTIRELQLLPQIWLD